MGEDKKAIFYIDGLNLYYGIKGLKIQHLKWLDVVKLAQSIAEQDKSSVFAVKYFTAIVYGEEPKNRQETYIAALEAHYANTKLLKVVKGKFTLKDKFQCTDSDCRKKGKGLVACMRCKRMFELPVEKRTDVNIACAMMEDLCEGNFGTAYLISGDGDLLTPIKKVRNKKRIVVCLPPNRPNRKFKKYTTPKSEISEEMLEQCMLPDKVQAGKKTYQRPGKWT